MKKRAFLVGGALLLASCGSGADTSEEAADAAPETPADATTSTVPSDLPYYVTDHHQQHQEESRVANIAAAEAGADASAQADADADADAEEDAAEAEAQADAEALAASDYCQQSAAATDLERQMTDNNAFSDPASLQSYTTSVLQFFTSVERPEAIASDIGIMQAATTQGQAVLQAWSYDYSGSLPEYQAVFAAPEVDAAVNTLAAYDRDICGIVPN